jgi:hypothetical protein
MSFRRLNFAPGLEFRVMKLLRFTNASAFTRQEN